MDKEQWEEKLNTILTAILHDGHEIDFSDELKAFVSSEKAKSWNEALQLASNGIGKEIPDGNGCTECGFAGLPTHNEAIKSAQSLLLSLKRKI